MQSEDRLVLQSEDKLVLQSEDKLVMQSEDKLVLQSEDREAEHVHLPFSEVESLRQFSFSPD